MRKILMVVTWCVYSLCFAQDYIGYDVEEFHKKKFVTTPEVASLFQYSAYPVNYSTGTVDIKIPLYEVKCGDLVLPIYLIYNSTGIKVNEPVSWVGQNWTLHAEPLVSYIPHGHDDSEIAYELGNQYSYEKALLMATYEPYKDFLPDEWLYSLLNKSGKYIYSPSKQKYITFPHDDVKVNDDEIIDVDGTRYIFNGGYDMQRSNYNRITCRRASKIIAPNGVDTIKFLYNNTRDITVKHIVDNIIVHDACQRRLEDNPYYPVGSAIGCLLQHQCSSTIPEYDFYHPRVYKTKDGLTSSYQVTFDQYDNNNNNLLYSDFQPNTGNGRYGSSVKTFIESHNISRIVGSYCTVDFIMGTKSEGQNLKRIEVTDNVTNEIVKTIEFVYQSAYLRDRSFLTKLIVYNKGNSNQEITSLAYESIGSIPDPGTRCVDLWGYLNLSISNDEILVPQMKLKVKKDRSVPVNGNVWQDDSLTIGSPYKRGADETCMQKGMLKTITYPTGASERFVFEANRAKIPRNGYYSSNTNDFHIVDQLTNVRDDVYLLGGLRIKEIITGYEGNELKHRFFKYGTNGNGYGYTRIVDGVNYFLTAQTKYYNHVGISGIYEFLPNRVDLSDYTRSRVRTISSFPIIPITYPNGSSVMYDKVTEYNGTPTVNAGKIEYSFKVNTSSAITDGSVYVFKEIYDTEYDQGILLNKKVFEKSPSNSYVLRTEDAYSYTKKEYPADIIRGCEFFISGFADYDPYHLVGNYVQKQIELYPCAALQKRHSHYEYNGDNCRVVNTYNTYEDDSTNLVTSITWSDANQTITERYSYPKDSANVYPYNEMLPKNIISPVIGTLVNGNAKYLNQNVAFEALINKNGKKFYEPTSIRFQYTENGPFENRLNCKYDKNTKLVEQIEDGIPTVYIWSYKGEYPIASISNCTYQQLILIIPVDTLNDISNAEQPSSYHWSLIEGLRNKIKNGELKTALITTYTYNPLLGMTSKTDSNGLTIEYEYDSFGRLSREYLKQPNSNRQLLKQYEYKYASQR